MKWIKLAQYVPTCQMALYESYLLIYISVAVSLVVCHFLFISYIYLCKFIVLINFFLNASLIFVISEGEDTVYWAFCPIHLSTYCSCHLSLSSSSSITSFPFFYFLLSNKNQWLFNNSLTPLQIYIALLHTGRFSKNTAFFLVNIFTSQGGLNRNSCSIFLSSCSRFPWYCISHCTYMLFMTESCAISMLWSGLVLHTTWSPP